MRIVPPSTSDTMSHGIFDKRLQQHTRYERIQSFRGDGHINPQPRTESGLLDRQILFGEYDFFGKWSFRYGLIVQDRSEKLADLRQHASSGRRSSFQDKRGHGIQ